MAYTRTYTIDAGPGGDTVKAAIATKLDGDLTSIYTNLTSHEAMTTNAHGVGAGTICGTTLTQTLTNKTLSAPTLTGAIAASGATISSPTITAATIQGASTLNGLVHTAATTGFTIAGGTTSKTLTVDETVAMSSLAPKTATIAGDGTAGRVLRNSRLVIADGTTGVSLKCTLSSLWNGDTIAATDDIAKTTGAGSFGLSSDGGVLTILNAGVAGNVVAVLSAQLQENPGGTAFDVLSVKTSLGLNIAACKAAANSQYDLTTLVDTGAMYINITYITSA